MGILSKIFFFGGELFMAIIIELCLYVLPPFLFSLIGGFCGEIPKQVIGEIFCAEKLG